MHRHPSPDAHADRPDLGLASGCIDPDSDASADRARRNSDIGECIDDPVLKALNIAPDIPPAPVEIELDIADALAGAVIGIAPAASAAMHREARVEQLVRLRAGACGIERRMLEQPDPLARRPVAD